MRFDRARPKNALRTDYSSPKAAFGRAARMALPTAGARLCRGIVTQWRHLRTYPPSMSALAIWQQLTATMPNRISRLPTIRSDRIQLEQGRIKRQLHA